MATPALSIMQPWCGLIALGFKPIENRAWTTRYRGPVLLHAGKTLDAGAMEDLLRGQHPVTGEPLSVDLQSSAFRAGGIVGEARVVDCVERSDSDWFVGPIGFVMADARVVEFRPCKGALGFFTPDFDSRYAEKPARAQKDAAFLTMELPHDDA